MECAQYSVGVPRGPPSSPIAFDTCMGNVGQGPLDQGLDKNSFSTGFRIGRGTKQTVTALCCNSSSLPFANSPWPSGSRRGFAARRLRSMSGTSLACLALWTSFTALQTGSWLWGVVSPAPAELALQGSPCHCHCEFGAETCTDHSADRPQREGARAAAPELPHHGVDWGSVFWLLAWEAGVGLAAGVGLVCRHCLRLLRGLAAAPAPAPTPALTAARVRSLSTARGRHKTLGSISSASSTTGTTGGALSHLAVDARDL